MLKWYSFYLTNVNIGANDGDDSFHTEEASDDESDEDDSDDDESDYAGNTKYSLACLPLYQLLYHTDEDESEDEDDDSEEEEEGKVYFRASIVI